MSWTRRAAIGGVAAGIAAPGFGQDSESLLGPSAEFAWATFDMANRQSAGVHPDLRLPMCSSFKWLLAACVLSRVDADKDRLDRRVSFSAADIQDYAPTSKAVLAAAGGMRGQMTVEGLCKAAVSLSDNTAANLLLTDVGGPAALTAWLRAHGDRFTRLDRSEPALNYVPVGDPRDTTTAAAMVGDLYRVLFGPVLTPASRKRLMRWMLACKTGDTRLKAGLPPGWRIAQKTGTLNYHPESKDPQRAASGNVGVLFPPRGAAILIAAYTAGSTRPQAEVDRWFAEVARRVTAQRA